MRDPAHDTVFGGQTRPIAFSARGICRSASLSPPSAALLPAASLLRLLRTLSLGSAVFFFLPMASSLAQTPRVLHDAGTGVSISHLLAQATTQEDGKSLVAYPVRTPQLKPGRLAGRPRWPDSHWLTQPVFLLGADAASRRWIRRHRNALAAMGASGMVVDVASADEFKALEKDAESLQLVPATSAWLAQRLVGLHAAVLPLLILPDGTLTQHPEASR